MAIVLSDMSHVAFQGGSGGGMVVGGMPLRAAWAVSIVAASMAGIYVGAAEAGRAEHSLLIERRGQQQLNAREAT